MIVRLLVFACLALTAGAGYFAYGQHKKSLCKTWLDHAVTDEKAGYYSDAIDGLTLYFSEDSCRTSNDTEAIKTLMNARLHVPVPGTNEAEQHLMLARLGWSLKRDPEFRLAEAASALSVGDWETARLSAAKATGAQATLIELTATIRLEDWAEVDELLSREAVDGLSPFQQAMLISMLQQAPVSTTRLRAPEGLKKFVQLLLKGGDDAALSQKVAEWKRKLSEDDLATASILLTGSGKASQAISLLDQPDRPMPETLLRRLARLLWNTKNYESLVRLNDRRAQTIVPADVQLIICLAQQQRSLPCSPSFAFSDYRRRHGRYAADSWNILFQAISAPDKSAQKTLDSLAAMKDLIAANPVALLLMAELYASIGETGLAQRYAKSAKSAGAQEFQLTKPDVALPCDGRKRCLVDYLTDTKFDPLVWRRAIETGVPLNRALIEKLEAHSPKEAVLWRLAKAKAELVTKSDKGAANSLMLIRPVVEWAPMSASAHLIAAAGYAHFADYQAAYGHLATGIKADPESAVAALRLSLTFYQADKGLSPIELVHWWTSMTRLELISRSAKGSKNDINSVLADRHAILAAYAEARKDIPLAVATYREMLQFSHDNHIALNNLAVKMLQSGDDLSEALRLAQRAIRLNPGEPEYANTLEEVQLALAASEL